MTEDRIGRDELESGTATHRRPGVLPIWVATSFLLLLVLSLDGASPGAAPTTPTYVAAELAPEISTVASDGGLPEQVVVRFRRPVLAPWVEEGAAPAGTWVRLEPAVAGHLDVSDPYTMIWAPRHPLAPDTDYRFELMAVETAGGIVMAPEPTDPRWRLTLHTPRFVLSRVEVGTVDLEARSADLDLIFSAPVRPSSLDGHVTWTLDGKPPRWVQYFSGPEARRSDQPARRVRARVTGWGLRGASRIELTLDEKLAMHDRRDARAASVTHVVELDEPERLRVKSVHVEEGATGHFIEVVCHDDAVDGRTRYHYDESTHRSYRLSRRCVPEESSGRERIHLDPPRPFRVTPSDAGFRIFGDFERGRVSVVLEAGLRSEEGGVLDESSEWAIDVPARSARVSFVSKGRYLPRDLWESLPVRHVNVDAVRVEIRHVPPKNLVYWMGDDHDERATEREADRIADETFPLAAAPDHMATTWLDVASMVPAGKRGLLEITISGHGSRDTARLLLTDLHLIAKSAPPERGGPDGDVLAWVLDAGSLGPVPGAELSLIRKSGRVLARCTTDESGGCRLKPRPDDTDDTPPFAILARRRDDLTYLKFSELRTEIAEERVHGSPYGARDPYRAALYADRGVYRPGEEAHLTGIVRDAEHHAPPAGMPVTLTVLDPREKRFRRVTRSTNAAGMVSLDLSFADFATTGRYRVRAEVGDRRVGETSFHVEEFVPERMEVEVRGVSAAVAPGERAEFAVEARYLFGGTPSGEPLELACRVEPTTFRPAARSEYHYGPWVDPRDERTAVRLGEVRGELDEHGRGTLACPSPAHAGTLATPGTVRVEAAVFEAGSGRTTTGRASLPFHPERFYVGLRSGAERVGAGSSFPVEGVVVDWQGQLVQDVERVKLELVRLEREYGWTYDEATGRGSYSHLLRRVVDGELDVEVVDGRFETGLEPTEEGEAYLVRATAGAARTELHVSGRGDYDYWMPVEASLDRTPRPTRPGWLDLAAPSRLRVGEEATIRFDAPFDGRVLLTVETDRVLSTEWRRVEAGPVEWTMPALGRFEPNVYLGAFLVKQPYLDDVATGVDEAGRYLPDRAFGVRSVRVEPEQLTQAVRLDVPDAVESRSRFEVSVDVGPGRGPGFATIAVVDEGILSLTGFASPDPLETLLARRALGVATFETVGWSILLPPSGAAGSHGGDGATDPLGRVMPVEPVALFAGPVEIPADGRVRVPFELPAYRGKLRVMVVTASAARIGRADASVVVRDPLVVQSTLPRTLVHGDEVLVPVSVTNLSGAARDVDVRIHVEPLEGAADAVVVRGDGAARLSLADGARGTASFRLESRSSVGAVRVRVEARSGELGSTEERSVPLVPAGARERRVQLMELEAGRTDLTSILSGWLPGTERTRIRVTRNRYGPVFEHLRYLVRYPYGCIEQTTSTTRPLLYVRELVGALELWPHAQGGVDDMVAHGIERIFSMQTPSGGFAYWPGGMTPSHWGTAYATQLLIEARQAGYPVPEKRLDDALDWIEGELKDRIERGVQVDGPWGRRSEPYLQYVLARAGRGRPARVRDLLAGIALPARGELAEHRLLLMAALYLSGDRRHEAELLGSGLEPLGEERDNGWTFYSDLRRRGLTLTVLADLFDREALGEELPDLVARALAAKRDADYTTQELAWGITGLGKLLARDGAGFDPPRLLADGRELSPDPRDPPTSSSERAWSLYRAGERDRLEIVVEDKGEGELYALVSSEGVRVDAPTAEGGEGLALSRRYLRMDGSLVDPARETLRLGEPLLVELSLENLRRERTVNVALVDRLPAGLEIENPRLGRGGALSWLDPERRWSVDHMNVRDDRLEVFGALGPLEMRTVVYAVRATVAGRFTAPAATAEAMYDPRIWARGERIELDVDAGAAERP